MLFLLSVTHSPVLNENILKEMEGKKPKKLQNGKNPKNFKIEKKKQPRLEFVHLKQQIKCTAEENQCKYCVFLKMSIF